MQPPEARLVASSDIARDPRLERVLVEDFPSRWKDFLSHVKDPSIYDSGHKVMAELGYAWGLAAARRALEKL